MGNQSLLCLVAFLAVATFVGFVLIQTIADIYAAVYVAGQTRDDLYDSDAGA